MTRLIDLSASPLSAPASAEAGKHAAAELKAAGKSAPELQKILSDHPNLQSFLIQAFSLSPFLCETGCRNADMLARCLVEPLDTLLQRLSEASANAWLAEDASLAAEADLMARLRLIKREASFAIALHDLARLTGAKETTSAISQIAEATLTAAFNHVLRAGHDAGKLKLKDPAQPSTQSGLIVIGMGKLGAGELNYSSDIDIVVFFDPRADIAVDRDEAADTFARMVRRIVRIMQERTAHGYVFRTDLRLRPDPGSTPLAIPVDAAIHYYESRGQNWERAAYIKAKPIAGDLDAGAGFLDEMRPFVFRKYLDYAAISDIHSIKRQIHAHRGFGGIAVKGHNVKLGRGGIREIEFFVQTQQLIAGGRVPELRLRRTDEMLQALAKARWIDQDTADEMDAAYWYLRDIEHRIQMVRDEQNHQLPEEDGELKRIALMMGEKSATAFSKTLITTLKSVGKTYAQLFEQEQSLSASKGNLVFTGDDNDPDTLISLEKLGFERPGDMSRMIRTWHYGRYRATQSAEARERLTELTPQLLEVFGASKRADEALVRFDAFLSGLPAGIQLFSILATNPALLSLLVSIMAAAPRLADVIARKPHIFDGMLDPTLLSELPTRDYLDSRMSAFLDGDFVYEEVLDRLRIFASEQKFLIGIRLLTGSIQAQRAGKAHSDLADIVIARALMAVQREMEAAHGTVSGGRVVVMGLGKLGSREMTPGSDVDMILLYDHDADIDESEGPKPLDPVRYFTRLTQRLMAALSAPTAEGVLYEVDLRLRPSGNKGPVATRLAAFTKYQREEAWTWEHMAMTRARIVAGDAGLGEEVRQALAEIRIGERTEKALKKDIAEMRALIESEKPPRDIWDTKLVPGGLIDIEFIAQYLALRPGASASSHPITSTQGLLTTLGPETLGGEATELVVSTLALLTEISQIVRTAVAGGFEPDDAPAALIDLVCRAADAPDLKALETDIRERTKAVRKLFRKSIG